MVMFGSKLLLVVLLRKSRMHPTYRVSTGPPINATILLSIRVLDIKMVRYQVPGTGTWYHTHTYLARLHFRALNFESRKWESCEIMYDMYQV